MFWYCSYRSALNWEDKTVDYFTEYALDSRIITRPVCALLYGNPGSVMLYECTTTTFFTQRSLCQIPHGQEKKRLHRVDRTDSTASGQGAKSVSQVSSQWSWSSQAMVNVTLQGQHGQHWNMVSCPTGHVTHACLACDVATSCWAEGAVSVSLRPDTWALPTSQSCPAAVAPTALSPLFACGSDEWHVPYSLVCDHRRDCLDGSDETFCKHTPCNWQLQLQCFSKQVCVEA